MRDVTEYPFVFFPVGLNLAGRRCVVIGPADDHEAVEKDAALREVGADVRWITDASGLRDEDLADAFFVISTPQDAELSRRLRALADRRKFLLCAIDQPTFGFVAMQAVVKAGPVRIAISTGGIAPRVGRRIREAFEHALGATFVRFIDCNNVQRERNRERLGTSSERRAAMIGLADGFEVEVTVRYPQWFEDELAVLEARRLP
ncbi:MAG: precorrin-2 dehydrogenase/sirohydrochlorin ferrochelatase family protein [Vulcanimicrobiaceae bacterium]